MLTDEYLVWTLCLPPSLAQHAAARLGPVDAVDDAVERLRGVHPDGHRAAHTLNIDARDEVVRQARLSRHQLPYQYNYVWT